MQLLFLSVQDIKNDSNTKGIILNDGSNLNLFGGSVEGFSESGIELLHQGFHVSGLTLRGV